jgi:hypothetical protein
MPKHPAQSLYQEGRRAQRYGDWESALLNFEQAARQGHYTALLLARSFQRRPVILIIDKGCANDEGQAFILKSSALPLARSQPRLVYSQPTDL